MVLLCEVYRICKNNNYLLQRIIYPNNGISHYLLMYSIRIPFFVIRAILFSNIVIIDFFHIHTRKMKYYLYVCVTNISLIFMKKIVFLSAIVVATLLTFSGCDKENGKNGITPKENGSEKGYQYIELGLSVRWATFNIGAITPEEYGDTYAWGENEHKDAFYLWEEYKWCGSSRETLTKYCTSSSYGAVDHKTTLDPEDDVAHVRWGGSWRMPTKAELIELKENCTWTWYGIGNTEFNGVAGYKVTSKIKGYTDRFIFLPAGGYRQTESLHFAGYEGYYWSSTLYTGGPFNSWSLYFDSKDVDANRYTARYFGIYVRPVCP